MILGTAKIVWGMTWPECLTAEISNLPPDVLKVRRKIRTKKEMQIFLKFKDRVEHWVPERDGDNLRLWLFRGSNKSD